MNYDTATNKDLNLRLLELLHGDGVRHFNLSADESFIYDCGVTGDNFYRIDLHDYCASWQETMPLAIENEISALSCEGGIYEISYDFYGDLSTHKTDELLTCSVDVRKSEVLRTIVIFLIKKLELDKSK